MIREKGSRTVANKGMFKIVERVPGIRTKEGTI